MPMPVQTALLGTSSIVYFPDYMVTPFQVGVAAIFSGGAGTATMDVTFDKIDVTTLGNVNATTAASANWINVVALTSATFTANYTTPVQAMRVNVVSAVATTVVWVSFLQAGARY